MNNGDKSAYSYMRGPNNAERQMYGIGGRNGHAPDVWVPGMTIREHFAAMAMQGFLSNRLEVPSTEGKKLVDFIAKCSVDYANALLKALENDDETAR